jgi:putative phage-type endonuclease
MPEMIEKHRFLAQSGTPEWHELRAKGVTATAVAKAATKSGFETAANEIWRGVEPIPDNPYMRFGREQETVILADLKRLGYDIEHNDWLICADGYTNNWQMATPDGLSSDHRMICEVKTTGKDWGSWAKVPLHYKRQVQWQLYVTGAHSCLFAWQLRVEDWAGVYTPAWLDPKTVIVPRDEELIAELVAVSERLQLEIIYREQAQMEGSG